MSKADLVSLALGFGATTAIALFFYGVHRWDERIRGEMTATPAQTPGLAAEAEQRVIAAALRWRAALRLGGDVQTRTDELLEQVEALDRVQTESRKNSRTIVGTSANLLIPDELHDRD